jgi:hypothetical protein
MLTTSTRSTPASGAWSVATTKSSLAAMVQLTLEPVFAAGPAAPAASPRVARAGSPLTVLFGVYESRGGRSRASLVYCGDDVKAKELARGLIHDAGFDPVDAGSLRIARYTEPFELLVGKLAYGGTGGPELGYRFESYGP